MRGGATLETKGFDRVLRQRIQALAGISITVGIHRGTQNKGIDVATYAAWNNFGTKNAMGWELIPARPFMMYSAKRIAGWMKGKEYRQLISSVIDGNRTPQQVVRIIGAKTALMTNQIMHTSSLYKPNSPETIARKGANKRVLENSGSLFRYGATFKVKYS
ncbi:hypothetical protein ACTQHD_07585 [Citrobacter freundii]|uniref:hypothetical protein n=1 Tax=Citrobacter freundii TaxID=546 RepID=UPI001A2D5EF3|nr:hypothetical protein [Citrobacter freundii]EKW4405813.1 hypothetical protein [Citrobacter freundii]ELJ5790228.1 hypothetical protein [Citrobacter freundii]WOR53136.1 hypothetical protein R5Q27_14355 [Citrobacter freundii]HAT2173808.1 hypothetical protein [Citrobacter freundii]HAT2255198.1 hypothetical protein [Citrobacter freundii]